MRRWFWVVAFLTVEPRPHSLQRVTVAMAMLPRARGDGDAGARRIASAAFAAGRAGGRQAGRTRTVERRVRRTPCRHLARAGVGARTPSGSTDRRRHDTRHAPRRGRRVLRVVSHRRPNVW